MSREARAVVLEDDTARFLGDKAALIVGVVGPDGRPFATRGWGLTVADCCTGQSRLLLDAADRHRFDHLADGGAIAVTGTDVPTLRSFQVKGRVQRIDAVDAADRAHSARYCDGFFGDIEAADHFPRWVLERMRPDALFACDLVIEEVFDQTPGPKAGSPVVEASS